MVLARLRRRPEASPKRLKATSTCLNHRKKNVEVKGDVVGEGAKCAVFGRNIEIKKANKGVYSKGKKGA